MLGFKILTATVWVRYVARMIAVEVSDVYIYLNIRVL